VYFTAVCTAAQVEHDQHYLGRHGGYVFTITGEDNFNFIGNARFCLPREQNNETVLG
jgi:hypothetical protein